MTQPSVATPQSGGAADALRTLQAELRGDYSAMRSAEVELTEAILTAHALTVSGRARLQDIQRQLIEAITDPVAALGTPAGERQFLLFLRGKIAEIQSIVDTGELTDSDHAKLTRALGTGYLVPSGHDDTTPASAGGASPAASPGGEMTSTLGSALGSLTQAAQGAATMPAQLAAGLAGAASPLAGLASGLAERGHESDAGADPGERAPEADPRRHTRDDTAADNEEADAAEDDKSQTAPDTSDRPEDRTAEPSPPGEHEPPRRSPAQTRPARLL